MIETIVLALLVLALVILLQYQDMRNSKERKELINRIIAKNITEVITLDKADEVVKEVKQVQSDFIPAETLDEDSFDKMIKQTLAKVKK